MIDKRIGKVGEYAPELTIGGREYRAPAPHEIGLGDGYYAVGDTFSQIGYDDVIEELKSIVTKAKAHGRKPSNRTDSETATD